MGVAVGEASGEGDLGGGEGDMEEEEEEESKGEEGEEGEGEGLDTGEGQDEGCEGRRLEDAGEEEETGLGLNDTVQELRERGIAESKRERASEAEEVESVGRHCEAREAEEEGEKGEEQVGAERERDGQGPEKEEAESGLQGGTGEEGGREGEEERVLEGTEFDELWGEDEKREVPRMHGEEEDEEEGRGVADGCPSELISVLERKKGAGVQESEREDELSSFYFPESLEELESAYLPDNPAPPPPPPPSSHSSLPSLFSHFLCLALSFSAATHPSLPLLLLLLVFLLSLRHSPPLPSLPSLLLYSELVLLTLFLSYLLLRSCCSVSLSLYLSLACWGCGLACLGLSLSLGLYYIPATLVSASFLSSPSLFLSLYLLVVLVVRPARGALETLPRKANKLWVRFLFRLPRPLFVACQSLLGGLTERSLYDVFPKAGRGWGPRQSRLPVPLRSVSHCKVRPLPPALRLGRLLGRPLRVLADWANARVLWLASRVLTGLPHGYLSRLRALGLLREERPSRLPKLLPREERERDRERRRRREMERRNRRREEEEMFRAGRVQAAWVTGLRRTASGRKVVPWR
ncbi:serine/threonine-protein kinase TAO2 [Amia ocellicauda]|uniref:serine/threonine-protein kinase TAO2 n=1 Tax=Amia ocellicauda TaxID=2972642 RepID=UPI003463ECBF